MSVIRSKILHGSTSELYDWLRSSIHWISSAGSRLALYSASIIPYNHTTIYTSIYIFPCSTGTLEPIDTLSSRLVSPESHPKPLKRLNRVVKTHRSRQTHI